MNIPGVRIRAGRKRPEQFMITDFDMMDAITEYSSIELLGFYIQFRRYINRATNTKDDQVTYKQTTLMKKFGIGNTKYYRLLKELYGVGLVDQEKILTVKYFVNHDIDGVKNELKVKVILQYSSIEKVDLDLKNKLSDYIAIQEEVSEQKIKIVSSTAATYYLVNDYPEEEHFKNGKLEKYRNFDDDLARFRKGKTKRVGEILSQNTKEDTPQEQYPQSQNDNQADSQNEGVPPSRNTNDINNIISLPNNISTSFDYSKSNQSNHNSNSSNNMLSEKEYLDMIDRVNSQIEFSHLLEIYPKERGLIENLRDLIVEVMTTSISTIRVNREDKNVVIVRATFSKLKEHEITYVIDSFKQNRTKVKNIKAYLLSTLYNAPFTMDSFYSSEVQHDMAAYT
ncbi:MAG: hypothetical protein JEZ08_22565 [Clostridiales bacterium]|nr:hypothetical protein [Clostridiales bacterium]